MSRSASGSGPRTLPRLRALGATLLALLAACQPPPPPVPENLAYPVLVLFEQSGTVRHDDVADLRVMGVQRVINSHSPPFLIDSRLDVYRLDNLASTRGGLWLMAHPSGHTDVTFDLVRVSSADVAQARQLLLEREVTLRRGDDPAMRRQVEDATTLAAMLDAIGKSPL